MTVFNPQNILSKGEDQTYSITESNYGTKRTIEIGVNDTIQILGESGPWPTRGAGIYAALASDGSAYPLNGMDVSYPSEYENTASWNRLVSNMNGGRTLFEMAIPFKYPKGTYYFAMGFCSGGNKPRWSSGAVITLIVGGGGRKLIRWIIGHLKKVVA